MSMRGISSIKVKAVQSIAQTERLSRMAGEFGSLAGDD